MSSGNGTSGYVKGQDGSKGELERVRKCLQEVTKKNQDLEEMLLYTMQELQKEKENSRKIVQTLTERLMESREMINKLEVENMRYKKDCMLAVELLQCNRSVDQRHLSSTVQKLSAYTDPVDHHNSTKGNPFALVNAQDCTNFNKTTKNVDINKSQPTRPRTASKKNKPEISGSNEDTKALLQQQSENEDKVKVLERDNKITKDTSLEYNKDLKRDQCEKTTDKTLSSKVDNAQEFPEDIEGVNGKRSTQSKDRHAKEENDCLTNERKQQSRTVIQLKIADNELDSHSIDHEGSNSEDNSPNENDVECLNDKWTQEDKPLIVSETGSSTTEQSVSKPESNANVKLNEENAHTVSACQTDSKNTGYELHGDVRQSTGCTLTTTTVENKNSTSQTKGMKDAVGDENDKLLDEERSEEHSAQQETNTAVPELTAEDNNETEDKQAGVMCISESGKLSCLSVDDSTKKESKTDESQVDAPVVEADDETSTAEENTPLV